MKQRKKKTIVRIILFAACCCCLAVHTKIQCFTSKNSAFFKNISQKTNNVEVALQERK